MYDVIIAGGGPIGSRVAFLLAEKGHRVLVLEKKGRSGTKSACTGIIGMECVRAFDIEESVILRKVNSARLFSPSGKELYLRREEPQACILDRAAFDISTVERAFAAGAEYRYGSRVTGVAIEKHQVRITFNSQGKPQTVTGRAAVIACGFNPGLLKKLGFGAFKDYTIGVQAEVEAPGCEEVEVYLGNVAPGFFAWLVPVAPPQARAGLLSRGNPGPYLRKWLAELGDRGKITSAAAAISYGGIPLRTISRSYGERMIAVGDAAGQVKSTTGGGIYYGLVGADIAAATLHEALEDDDLSAKRLAHYERGWQKRLGKELRTDYWFRKIFERLGNGTIDSLFDAVKSSGIDEAMLKAENLSFDWHRKAIMKLLKYQVVSRTIGKIKMPFKDI
jgi:geranylgeranyl reductase family protein